jgi:hypothetical protein
MNIILVHVAWADGSCWSGVIERLQAAGHHVTAPQFPEAPSSRKARAGVAAIGRRLSQPNPFGVIRNECG